YLDPAQGKTVTLTVTVTPAAGSRATVQTDHVKFVMPLPTSTPPTSSTTTTTLPGSTTVPTT
ncbi:MAG TPA: hypothetical protein VKV25_02350, partial [Acidimicrobiales bacterium]|nr:hypothetical protein [Acidimicrobiales bacterium]